jgi:hypothetical protein
MNSKAQKDDIDPELPPWVHRACTEGTETSLGCHALKPYGIDVVRGWMPFYGISLLKILCDSNRAQIFVDGSSEERRTATWVLLRSWGVGCTPKRLELRTSDVWRLLEDHLVTMQGKKPLVSIHTITLLVGDIDDEAEFPGSETLSERRLHLFTFMHLCLECNHKLFVELWKALVGPPANEAEQKSINDNFCESHKDQIVSMDTKMVTVMEIHAAQISLEEHRAEKRRAKARRARKGRSEKKRLVRVLIERNADVDDSVCVICLDEPSNVRFGPCHHICCCVGCAEMLDKCCLCRRVIETREGANPVPATVKPTKAKAKAKASPTQGPLTKNEACLKVFQHRCKTERQTKDFVYELLKLLEQPENKRG